MMNKIEDKMLEIILNEVLNDFDVTKYKEYIEKAVDDYFKSESFVQSIHSAFEHSDMGYCIGESLVKSIYNQTKEQLKKTTITVKLGECI